MIVSCNVLCHAYYIHVCTLLCTCGTFYLIMFIFMPCNVVPPIANVCLCNVYMSVIIMFTMFVHCIACLVYL